MSPDARRGREQREPRLISRCRVELDHRSGASEGETEDVSLSGLYIRTETILPVGDETDLRLHLPDGSLVALYARVAHVLTPDAARALGRHAGMGLELIGPDTPARSRLIDHLQTLQGDVRTGPLLSTTTQVIVAEPSPPLRTRMVRCLEAAGFTVHAVASAMDVLDAGIARPDAIICAAQLPSMTGVDLAYAMSEHAALAEVPLILTGDDGDHGRLEAYRAGVRDYIPVPFLDEELVIRVHRVAAPSPAAHGLRGSLVDIGLGTLLTLLEFERKSGVLLVVRPGELARVFVADGKLLKVETSASDGTPGHDMPKDRLMSLLDWRDGQFEFSPADIGGRDELGLSVTHVLLEHARTRDEEQQRRQPASWRR